MIILLFLLHRWFVDDTRRARAADIRADRDGDPGLDAYNDYLARLPNPSTAGQEQTRHSG